MLTLMPRLHSMLWIDTPPTAPTGVVPAIVLGGKMPDAQTVFKIFHVLLMDIRLRVIFVLAVLPAREGRLNIHVQIDDKIGLWQAELTVLQII